MRYLRNEPQIEDGNVLRINIIGVPKLIRTVKLQANGDVNRWVIQRGEMKTPSLLIGFNQYYKLVNCQSVLHEPTGFYCVSIQIGSMVEFHLNGTRVLRVRLLWKPMKSGLNNNFGIVVMGRLRSFWKEVSENPAFFQKYHNYMLEQEVEGLIEEVTDFMNGFPVYCNLIMSHWLQ
uniref:Uncharacterized protein n=1 Tax=Acrobeloides nanus TaxID=290746 RepID=A0A914DXH4_9BILA